MIKVQQFPLLIFSLAKIAYRLPKSNANWVQICTFVVFIVWVALLSYCAFIVTHRYRCNTHRNTHCNTHCNTQQRTLQHTPQHTWTHELHFYLKCIVCDFWRALVSRIDKRIGLFCKRALWKSWCSAKETYKFKEPTNCIVCDYTY